MPRLIDADMLEPSEVYMDYGFTRIVYMDDIDEMPTVDAVDVVRCKDCMYLEPSLNSDWSWCCYFDSGVRGDDFCSHGERREDGNNKPIWNTGLINNGKLEQVYEMVAVVRCKDCVHYWKNKPTDDVPVCLASPKDDAFCSEGERREDADK